MLKLPTVKIFSRDANILEIHNLCIKREYLNQQKRFMHEIILQKTIADFKMGYYAEARFANLGNGHRLPYFELNNVDNYGEPQVPARELLNPIFNNSILEGADLYLRDKGYYVRNIRLMELYKEYEDKYKTLFN